MLKHPFFLERYFARFEFSVRHLLSSSDCESLTVTELLDLADPKDRDAFLNLRLGYTESSGAPDLRELVAARAGVAADEVVIAAPQETVYLTMRALLDAGDRIITSFPCYQSLYEVADSIGCTVDRWSMTETPSSWKFDLDVLDHLATHGTKAIVVNFPHNPTGAMLTSKEWHRLQSIADRAGAYLISDEMYRGFDKSAGALPSAANSGTRAVSIGGLSKAYGLPGLRIGWVAARDKKLLAAIREYHDYTTICNSGPSERLAVIALKHAEKLNERCRAIVAANLPIAESFMQKHAARFGWLPPDVGPIAFVRHHPGNVHAFCEQVAEKASILLLPSTMFDWGDHHIRIGLGRASFPQALAALDDYLMA